MGNTFAQRTCGVSQLHCVRCVPAHDGPPVAKAAKLPPRLLVWVTQIPTSQTKRHQGYGRVLLPTHSTVARRADYTFVDRDGQIRRYGSEELLPTVEAISNSKWPTRCQIAESPDIFAKVACELRHGSRGGEF